MWAEARQPPKHAQPFHESGYFHELRKMGMEMRGGINHPQPKKPPFGAPGRVAGGRAVIGSGAGWHSGVPVPPSPPRHCDRSPPPSPQPIVPCCPLCGPPPSPLLLALPLRRCCGHRRAHGECPPWRLPPPPPSRHRSSCGRSCRTCHRTRSRPRCSAGAWGRPVWFSSGVGGGGWGGGGGGRAQVGGGGAVGDVDGVVGRGRSVRARLDGRKGRC